jgi:hypothetical protein
MRVSLAAAVLSHSVSAGMTTHVTLGSLPPEAQYTAAFVDRMDKLFDTFNSKFLYNNLKPLNGGVRDGSLHETFLVECAEWLKTWTVPTAKHELHFIRGWMISITSLLTLWRDLHTNFGLNYLLTNRLNQDCLENLFSIIRQKGGQRDNPDTMQFASAFRSVAINNMLSPSRAANCQADADTLFATLKTVDEARTISIPRYEVTNAINPHDRCNSHIEEAVFETAAEDNVFEYICGYVTAKITKKHTGCCDVSQLKNPKPQLNEARHLLRYKALSKKQGMFGGLTVASEVFRDQILLYEQTYRNSINGIIHAQHVRKRLHTMLSSKSQSLPSLCERATSEIIDLFLRLRLHGTLKFFTRDVLHNHTIKRPNRKILKLSHQ